MTTEADTPAADPPNAVCKVAENRDGGDTLLFWCPGCKGHHGAAINGSKNPVTGAKWEWNGDLVKPTLTPSVLVHGKFQCHLFVRDGQIQFLQDCFHDLKGQTVAMEPLE